MITELDVKKVRVIYHNNYYYVQARVPWLKGIIDKASIFPWFGVDTNFSTRNHGTVMVDKYGALEEAEKFAKKYIKHIETRQIELRRKGKNGTVHGTFKIKNPEDDPEHFV